MKLTNELKAVIERARVRLANDGTSEGAKKGWETRRAGGAVPSAGKEEAGTSTSGAAQGGGADKKWEGISDEERAQIERDAKKYGFKEEDLIATHRYLKSVKKGSGFTFADGTRMEYLRDQGTSHVFKSTKTGRELFASQKQITDAFRDGSIR